MLFSKIKGPFFSLSVPFNSINASFTHTEANDSRGFSQEEDYLTVTFTNLLVPVISL